MNKPFSRRPRSRFPDRLFSGIVPLLVAGVIIVLVALGILRLAAPGAFMLLARPLWASGSSLSEAAASANVFESRSALTRERNSFAVQNAALTSENAGLAAQVNDLTALLGTRTAPEKGIVASVLSRPPVAPYDVLILDQGMLAGVAVGAAVQGAGGTPVGTISEVGNSSSRVSLYSTRGAATQGWAGQGRIPLTLTGKGAGAFTASVLREAGIVVGDGVYVSGNGAFPIGTVAKIESDPSSPQVQLDVRPYTNPFSLTVVTVSRQ